MDESDLNVDDDRQRSLLLRGMELARTLTRGSALITADMLQRHLGIDFHDARWLLGQLRASECPMD